MSEQINVRMPKMLMESASNYAKEFGYSNVQDLMKEALRQKLFDEGEITRKELELIREVKDLSLSKNSYLSEEELFKKLSK
jgi:Arc/MetJ-type ribon-helix-helix transcriptional regulator